VAIRPSFPEAARLEDFSCMSLRSERIMPLIFRTVSYGKPASVLGVTLPGLPDRKCTY